MRKSEGIIGLEVVVRRDWWRVFGVSSCSHALARKFSFAGCSKRGDDRAFIMRIAAKSSIGGTIGFSGRKVIRHVTYGGISSPLFNFGLAGTRLLRRGSAPVTSLLWKQVVCGIFISSMAARRGMPDSGSVVYANKRYLRAGSVVMGLLGGVVFRDRVADVAFRESILGR